MGLKDTTTGDTLSDQSKPVILESMTFPAPVINVAIEPRTKGDQDKLGTAIQRLAEEDPTFQVRTDEETGQTIIAGMGELHLEVLVDRMRREFKVEANIGRPAGRLPRDRPQEGREGRVHPQEADRRRRPVRPGDHQPGADRRRRRRLRVREQDHRWPGPARVHPVGGRRAARRPPSSACWPGYPMVDVKVTLTDGAYHEVDSSELAFKIAGSMAFKKAAGYADPVLLEPVMAVEVRTPEDYMGEVIGDLNSRRGQIQAMEERTGVRVVKARRAAVRDVRLRGRPAQPDPGPGGLQHAVRLVCRGAAEHRQGDHRQGTRRVTAEAAAPAVHRTQQSYRTQERGRSQRGDTSGEGQVRADQAARQHRHHRAHRPRQDHADRGDHQGAARQVPRREPLHSRSTRSTTRRKRRSAGSRSRSRTSSTRPRSGTTRTWTAPVTPTTSRT